MIALCPFGEPAQLRKKRARLFSSHYEASGVESARLFVFFQICD